MDIEHLRKWFSMRIRVADEIVAQHGESGFADAEILLCCAISALAAQMWHGESIDKKRFTQFLVQFTEPRWTISRISIPLLARNLEAAKEHNDAVRVRRKYLPALPVVIDVSNDKSEVEVIRDFPMLSRRVIRSSSYASSIYSDLRSGLVHRFELSPNLAPYSYSDRVDMPSYLNLQDNPFDPTTGSVSAGETSRFLHFPYRYIREVSLSAADASFEFWSKKSSWDQPVPQWWIDG